MSEAIKIVRFQKRRRRSPGCFNCAPVFRLMPCVMLADGDGVQDHLLPVCEDNACQSTAIYLSKSGSTEVLDVCVVNLVTCTVHSLLFLVCPLFFFFFCSPFKSVSTNYISCSPVLTSLSSSQHLHITWPVGA